ncbi:hypothetical protein QFC19_004954 [Naganishia cerealis]|uniref:Uncharacterized protein n=1 Tax=Naganishia cerealis TaxID=610337 RepID=A0ACC2VS62_9TREE|nr:hypothetical protein QFC19_004954 [Naganishia cerealis]
MGYGVLFSREMVFGRTLFTLPNAADLTSRSHYNTSYVGSALDICRGTASLSEKQAQRSTALGDSKESTSIKIDGTPHLDLPAGIKNAFTIQNHFELPQSFIPLHSILTGMSSVNNSVASSDSSGPDPMLSKKRKPFKSLPGEKKALEDRFHVDQKYLRYVLYQGVSMSIRRIYMKGEKGLWKKHHVFRKTKAATTVLNRLITAYKGFESPDPELEKIALQHLKAYEDRWKPAFERWTEIMAEVQIIGGIWGSMTWRSKANTGKANQAAQQASGTEKNPFGEAFQPYNQVLKLLKEFSELLAGRADGWNIVLNASEWVEEMVEYMKCWIGDKTLHRDNSFVETAPSAAFESLNSVFEEMREGPKDFLEASCYEADEASSHIDTLEATASGTNKVSFEEETLLTQRKTSLSRQGKANRVREPVEPQREPQWQTRLLDQQDSIPRHAEQFEQSMKENHRSIHRPEEAQDERNEGLNRA